MTEIRQYALVLEGTVEPEREDGGRAQIAEINDIVEGSIRSAPSDEEGFFVRLQSWSKDSAHPEMDFFKGKRVRVTVEVLP